MSSVERAYGRRSAEYIDLFGKMDATAAADRELVGEWARALSGGRLLDVGCGPGQWTQWLHAQGMRIERIDPTPEFVAHAQQRYPEVSFALGRAERLAVQDAAVAGILAWYSPFTCRRIRADRTRVEEERPPARTHGAITARRLR